MAAHHRLPVLTTKFYRPPPPADVLARPQLFARLNEGLDRPLILVSAAAGSGKTTLLSSWLDTAPHRHVWISLDEQDNELVLFVAELVEAIQRIYPTVGEESLALVHGANSPPRHALLHTLIHELAKVDDDFVVVLDDYQFISERSIHEFLTQLLRHPPPTLRLVLATRRDPPLSLITLLAQNQMVEIRTQELLFAAEECEAFLRQSTDVDVEPRMIELLMEKTEGWATGLRLTALALRQHGDWGRVQEGLHRNIRQVNEYLTEEALAGLPPALHDFLLQTSILDQFCIPLCDAVVNVDALGQSSAAIIQQLAQANLFVVTLDAEGRWYRYHQLFRQHLRHQLSKEYSPAAIAALHERASSWFAEQGLVAESIDYSVTAGDWESAARLFAQQRYELMNREEYQRLGQWLEKFPAQFIESHPQLLLQQTWFAIASWPLDDRLARLDQIEERVGQLVTDATQFAELRGEIDVLRTGEYQRTANAIQQERCALRALASLPAAFYSARTLGRVYLGNAQLHRGDLRAAQRNLRAGFQDDATKELPYRMRMLLVACVLHWRLADQRQLAQDANLVVQLQNEQEMPESHGWARTFLGHSSYLRNDLTAAEEHYTVVSRQRHRMPKLCVAECEYGLALIQLVRGFTEKANEILAATSAYVLEISSTTMLLWMRHYQINLALRQGELALLSRWVGELDELLYTNSDGAGLCIRHLTRSRVLVAQNTPASRRRAAELLGPLGEFAEHTHNYRFRAEVLILQSLLRAEANDEEGALSALTEALQLLERAGYVRTFVDYGEPVAALLRKLRAQGMASDFLARTLAAFPTSANADAAAQQLALLAPLTTREIEVLELLTQRYSNKEIAQKLVVSIETVRKHATNLYQKLAVGGRRQAVIKATAMGILPQEKVELRL